MLSSDKIFKKIQNLSEILQNIQKHTALVVGKASPTFNAALILTNKLKVSFEKMKLLSNNLIIEQSSRIFIEIQNIPCPKEENL